MEEVVLTITIRQDPNELFAFELSSSLGEETEMPLQVLEAARGILDRQIQISYMMTANASFRQLLVAEAQAQAEEARRQQVGGLLIPTGVQQMPPPPSISRMRS